MARLELGVFLVVAPSACSTSTRRVSPPTAQREEEPSTVEPSQLTTFVPIGTLRREATFADYVVRVYRDADLPDSPVASFEVLKGGKRVWAEVGERFCIGLPRDEWAKDEQQPEPPDLKPVTVRVGQDITGHGIPEAR